MSTEKLDTGLPGFVVDGRLHHLSPGAPNREDDHPEVTPAEKQGQISSFANPLYPEIVDAAPLLDIAKSTRNTLAAYLGRQTSRRNYIPIDEPNSPIDTDPSTAIIGNETKLLGNNNVVPDIKPASNTRFFVEKKKLDSQGAVPPKELWGWSGGNRPGAIAPEPISPPTKNLETSIGPVSLVKGQQDGWNSESDNFISGNDILSDEDNAKEMRRTYVSAVLKNNRFTPLPPENEKYRASHDLASLTPKKMKTGETRTVDDQGNTLAQTWNPQVEYEQIEPNELDGKMYNPVLYHPKYGGVTMGRLAQIGTSLSLRGSLELNSSDSKQNPSGGGSEAAALLPSPNQMGMTKIRQELLEAKNVLDNLTLTEIEEGQYIDINNSSWGSMNNVHDQFSGLTALGQMATSIGLSVMVGGVLGGLFELFSGWIKADGDSIYNATGSLSRDEKYMGSYSGDGKFGETPGFGKFLKKFLGVNDTVYAWDESVNRGISIFYGFEGADGILSALGSMAKTAAINSIFASGQSVVVSRSIIRGVRSVITAIGNLGSTINFIDVFKSILGVIETFASSKLVGAFNMFAAIGDAALLGEELTKKNSQLMITNVDHFNNRIISGSLETSELNWSAKQAKSFFVRRSSLGSLDNTVGTWKDLGGSSADSNFKLALVDSRISTQEREQFESELDGAYVPFYFHDLRTNEIISFHAFLTSLTDGFSVNYDSTEGFGRIEPVKTYKGTQRKIGLEFVLVATNGETDFDAMWEKVNKLTMLLYPQYTEGRRLSTDSGHNFIQPFSQMIGASPLIRLRLGNLFRSNYSRFALARLFGAGLDPSISFIEKDKAMEEVPAGNEFQSKLNEKINFKLEEYKKNGKEFVVSSDGLKRTEFSPPIRKMKKKFYDNFNTEISRAILTSSLFVIEKEIENGDVICRINKKSYLKFSEEQRRILRNTDDLWVPKWLAATEHLQDTFTVKIHKNLLNIPPEVKSKILTETQNELYDENDAIRKNNEKNENFNKLNKNVEFFKPANNSLVKSFKSAGGKGLAGVIESMDFNWYEQVMWDISDGRKAPQMCKINISFAPIHDIAPGLDSQGNNRAPIYPVGTQNRPADDKFDKIWGPSE